MNSPINLRLCALEIFADKEDQRKKERKERKSIHPFNINTNNRLNEYNNIKRRSTLPSILPSLVQTNVPKNGCVCDIIVHMY